jgi:hypothetical protein
MKLPRLLPQNTVFLNLYLGKDTPSVKWTLYNLPQWPTQLEPKIGTSYANLLGENGEIIQENLQFPHQNIGRVNLRFSRLVGDNHVDYNKDGTPRSQSLGVLFNTSSTYEVHEMLFDTTYEL